MAKPTTREPSTPFGRRLQEAYVRAGMTRGALARELGTYYPTVFNWEHGTQPGPDYLRKIADVLNVSIQWLLTGAETTEEATRAAVEEFLASPAGADVRPEEAEILRSLRIEGDLPPDPEMIRRLWEHLRIRGAGRR